VTSDSSPGDHPIVELEAGQATQGTQKAITIPAVGGGHQVVTVNIPAGVRDGTLLRLAGKGIPAPEGGPPGDAFVRVRINASAAPPRRKSPNRLAVVGSLVAILVVVIAIAFAGQGTAPVALPASTSATTPVPATATPQTPVTTQVAQSDPNSDVRLQDCLRNYGTDAHPDMRSSVCVAGTYRVLDRKYGTVDAAACDQVSGRTHDYVTELYIVTYTNGVETGRSLDRSRSYVFCLQQVA
jgi:hypothetical protein